MTLMAKETTIQPCVATIGSFDGVHQGHQFVLRQVVSQARQRGLDAVAVTFSNHPLQVLRPGFTPQLLTLPDEKVRLLQQTDIAKVVLLDFTPAMAQMTARDFMSQVLKEQLHVQVLLIGYDNHFGHDGKGFHDYVQYGNDLGIEVLPAGELEGGYSSTAIRQAILEGDITTANTLLGHPYTLQGTVVQGFQNGRKLGFPTANLQIDPLKLIPENGAYLVRTSLAHPLSKEAAPQPPLCFGMLNIGTRPTLHNGKQRSIEVHLFDFEGDLYGQSLQIDLLHHLRKEIEFRSLDELKAQLLQDEQACRHLIPHCS
ncbi:MAG: bifunctional riboflavin kinase/FAD synthetase [Bacteroidaceae bacterium]|nr:bifunctional riboflavin kinase/FAD synthetase [Bacteroidaceae bacterium]